MMNKNNCFYLFALFLIGLLAQACEETIYVPKPRGYPRVIYPTKVYQKFSEDYCAFTFEYPAYANVVQDTTYFDGQAKDACWFDIDISQFAAKIYCSYVPIGESNTFEKLQDDAFTMANEHIVKANYIDEIPVATKNEVKGMAFDLEGPVASPFMFYLTDEKEHFLRGSLYFNTKANPDSLAPVVKFIKEDLSHMIATFEWNE